MGVQNLNVISGIRFALENPDVEFFNAGGWKRGFGHPIYIKRVFVEYSNAGGWKRGFGHPIYIKRVFVGKN